VLQLPLSPKLERTLGIAVAGHHHIVLVGPRGSGKTRAIERLASLLPEDTPLSRLQRLLLEELRDPFARAESTPCAIRRVSTFVKPAALTGGFGSDGVVPGEFSLAHGGLLIADEFLEWPRDSREALREPLEAGVITLTRAKGSTRLPAGFLLAATSNPCPCGLKLCRCPKNTRDNYWRRLSGPIRDRIDIGVHVENASTGAVTPFSASQDKIRLFQKRARELWGYQPGRIPAETIEVLIKTNPSWQDKKALKSADSLRSRHKTVRLALSLGLWDGADTPTDYHFYEAELYRDLNPFSAMI
jgi:magnesium chelatase family protein